MTDSNFDSSKFGANMLGIERACMVGKTLQEAYASPEAYYAKRLAAMEDLKKQSNKWFEDKYTKLKGEGWDEGKCRDRAAAFTKNIMAATISEFEAEFPQDITRISAELVARRSKTSQKLVGAGISSALTIPKVRKSKK